MPQVKQLLSSAAGSMQAGELNLAEERFRRVLAADPGNISATIQLGMLLGRQGRYQDSCAVLAAALPAHQHVAELHYNLGLTLQNMAAWNDAITCYDNAILMNPDYATAYINRGSILQAQGQNERAIADYDHAIMLGGNRIEALNNSAVCLRDLGRLDEALVAVEAAHHLAPDNTDVISTHGTVLQKLGRFELALDRYYAALRLAPENAGIRSNLANCLDAMDRVDQALGEYSIAQSLMPNNVRTRQDVIICLTRQGRYEDAMAECAEASRLWPDDAELDFHYGALCLLTGDLEQGWRRYESRLSSPKFEEKYLKDRRWDGAPLPGKTVVVRAEQGYGDTLQFVRLLSKLEQLKVRVIFECQPGLGRLLNGVAGATEILERPASNTPIDVPGVPQIPLLSLPGYLGIGVNEIPCEIPYVHPDARLIEDWRKRLASYQKSHPHKLKIGICWAGRTQHLNDLNRSISLDQFGGLGMDSALFFSLQKGDVGVQAATPPTGMRLIDLAPDLTDFAVTAAVIENLDLVISVDTSIAHLAGALGKPVWNLIPSNPDWRWLIGRNDSPWYPTMRLFRQSRQRQWTTVFADIRSELERYIESPIDWQIADSESRHAGAIGDDTKARSIKLVAKANLLELARRNPNHAGILNTLGALSWADGDIETAVSALSKALSLDPDDSDIVANCADVMIAIGQDDVAEKLCRNYLEQHPGEEEIEKIASRVGSMRCAIAA